MQIREIMSKPVVTCTAETPLRRAAEMMDEHDVGCLPVVSQTELLGVLTDRDIATRGVARGVDPSACAAREVMTSERLCAISQDESVENAGRLMSEHKVRRLLVVGDQDEFVGMLSLGDLACVGREEGSDAHGVLATVCR